MMRGTLIQRYFSFIGLALISSFACDHVGAAAPSCSPPAYFAGLTPAFDPANVFNPGGSLYFMFDEGSRIIPPAQKLISTNALLPGNNNPAGDGFAGPPGDPTSNVQGFGAYSSPGFTFTLPSLINKSIVMSSKVYKGTINVKILSATPTSPVNCFNPVGTSQNGVCPIPAPTPPPVSPPVRPSPTPFAGYNYYPYQTYNMSLQIVDPLSGSKFTCNGLTAVVFMPFGACSNLQFKISPRTGPVANIVYKPMDPPSGAIPLVSDPPPPPSAISSASKYVIQTKTGNTNMHYGMIIGGPKVVTNMTGTTPSNQDPSYIGAPGSPCAGWQIFLSIGAQ